MTDSRGLASWANAITAGRLMLSPLMFWVIPDHAGGSWVAFWMWFAFCVAACVASLLVVIGFLFCRFRPVGFLW